MVLQTMSKLTRTVTRHKVTVRFVDPLDQRPMSISRTVTIMSEDGNRSYESFAGLWDQITSRFRSKYEKRHGDSWYVFNYDSKEGFLSDDATQEKFKQLEEVRDKISVVGNEIVDAFLGELGLTRKLVGLPYNLRMYVPLFRSLPMKSARNFNQQTTPAAPRSLPIQKKVGVVDVSTGSL